MRKAILKLAAVVLILAAAGCADSKFNVLQGDKITGLIAVSDGSPDLLVLEFRSIDGTLQRRLFCDKWTGRCVDGK